jgi:2-methylaconitate cis-trans-isomerase PrpF
MSKLLQKTRPLAHAHPVYRLTPESRRCSSMFSKKQNRLPAAYYRGGTSRAIIFRQDDLPSDRKQWEPIFCGAIGSPDGNGRQLDGMGGGISSLSKICVVGPSTHPDADVDYTFAAIGVKLWDVDYSSNCGNMTSAIGPFAVDTGMVKVKDGEATVKIHNTNTGKIIHSTFLVVDGEAASSDAFAIDGVAGTAAKIALAFINPASVILHHRHSAADLV